MARRGGAPEAGAPPTQDNAESAEATQETRPAVENRWWVDSGTVSRRASREATSEQPGDDAPARLVGERLFRAGRGFDQDRARARLTGSNLNWIREANPPENGWAHVTPAETQSRPEVVERVKAAIRLPAGARAVLIDSGSSVRVVATGSPVGERVVELAIGAESSFDAWLGEEWVAERFYRNRDRALRDASGFLSRYLRADR